MIILSPAIAAQLGVKVIRSIDRERYANVLLQRANAKQALARAATVSVLKTIHMKEATALFRMAQELRGALVSRPPTTRRDGVSLAPPSSFVPSIRTGLSAKPIGSNTVSPDGVFQPSTTQDVTVAEAQSVLTQPSINEAINAEVPMYKRPAVVLGALALLGIAGAIAASQTRAGRRMKAKAEHAVGM